MGGAKNEKFRVPVSGQGPAGGVQNAPHTKKDKKVNVQYLEMVMLGGIELSRSSMFCKEPGES